MRNRTLIDFDALLASPEEVNPVAEISERKSDFFDFSIEEVPELGEDDPFKLTLFTSFGRRGGAKMGELEGVTAAQILSNPRLLGADPGNWVNFKNGCPFAPSSTGGMNAKGKGIALKCDGQWLNFLCRDPAHNHPEHLIRTDKQGNNFWLWGIRNPESSGFHGRKFPPFKLGDHVELAEAIISLLGDCAWDSGDRIRVFDANFSKKGSRAASPTAGLWKEVPEDDVKRAIRELSGEWVKEGSESKPKYSRIKLSNAAVNGIYEQVLSILRQGLRPGPMGLESKFANPGPRIIFRGSALDLTDNRVYYAEKMRDLYATPEEQLDVAYSSDPEEPRKFLDFLREVWAGQPDLEERILFLQEWIGMALSGKAVEVECHLFLQGTLQGRNGKSRLINIIEGLFPRSQVSGLSFEDLSHNFKLCMLLGSRLNVYPDIRAEVVNSALVKQVTSGDVLTMDRKFQAPIVARSKAAWIVGVNDTFIPSEGDKATYRRWKILTFDRVFTDSEAKSSIAEDILAEDKSKIIHWAIAGLKRRISSGRFTEFASGDEAMRSWKHRADSVEQWLQDCVELIPEESQSSEWVKREDHYAAYSEWAKRSGFKPAALTRFGQTVQSYGLSSARVRRGGKQLWIHKIRIVQDDAPTPRPTPDLSLN
jgi:P4 family phage/plasmid primase-like protien